MAPRVIQRLKYGETCLYQCCSTFGITCDVHAAFEFSLRDEHDANSFSRLFSLSFGSSCKVPSFSPSMRLYFQCHHMRCSLFCAPNRDTARENACLDLAISLAGQVLFTTAVFLAPDQALHQTGDLNDLDDQGFRSNLEASDVLSDYWCEN